MKKLFFICLLPLFTSAIYAQSITLAEFESLITAKSFTEKSALLITRGFAKEDKEGGKADEPARFTKGLYMNGNVSSIKELVFLSAGVASYVVKDPQYYTAFKKQIAAKYKKSSYQMPSRYEKQITYTFKTTNIMIEETTEKIGDTGVIRTAWYFTIVKL
jgi:hypothetical protein